MTDSYNFSSVEIEDLLNKHAYEVAELIEQAYNDLENELKDLGDLNACEKYYRKTKREC